MRKTLIILLVFLSGSLFSQIKTYKDSNTGDVVQRLIKNTTADAYAKFGLVTGTDTTWITSDGDNLNITGDTIRINGDVVYLGKTIPIDIAGIMDSISNHNDTLQVHRTELNASPFVTSGNYIHQRTLTDSVGIWDATPSYPLDVNGEMRVVGNAMFNDTIEGVSLVLTPSSETGQTINQDDDFPGLVIDSEATSEYALKGTGRYGFWVVQDILGGRGLLVERNNNSVEAAALVEFKNDHVTDTYPTLSLQNDGSGVHITTSNTNENLEIDPNGTGGLDLTGFGIISQSGLILNGSDSLVDANAVYDADAIILDSVSVHLDTLQALRVDINANLDSLAVHLDTLQVLRVDINTNYDTLVVHRTDINTNIDSITVHRTDIDTAVIDIDYTNISSIKHTRGDGSFFYRSAGHGHTEYALQSWADRIDDTIALHLDTLQVLRTDINANLDSLGTHLDTLQAHNTRLIALEGVDTTGLFHTNRTALNAVSGTNTGDQGLTYNAGTHTVELSAGSDAIIPLAVDDGATEGLASFATSDFTATAGNIVIDYANGQKVTTSQPGFATSTLYDSITANTNARAITDNYIVVGTGTSIEGDANLIWNGTQLKVTGNQVGLYLDSALIQYPENHLAIGYSSMRTLTYVVHDTVEHDNTSWHSLYLDGLTKQMVLSENTGWTFEIMVTGLKNAGTAYFSYKINGFIQRDGSNNTTLRASNVTTIVESDANFNCQVIADDTNEALEIQVTDAVGSSDLIIWAAKVDIIEVEAETLP